MKKIAWILGLIALAVLLWYFFIKKEHYQISFTTQQPPGVVYHHILDWPLYGKKDSLTFELLSKDHYSQISQQIGVKDSLFQYQWYLKKDNDSITQVTVKITNTKNPWAQKLKIPLVENDFVSRSIQNVETVGEQLIKKSENFKVGIISDTLLPSTYCAYVPLSASVTGKTQSMLGNISLVMLYLKDHNIPLDGPPFLEVTHWDQENDSIRFNFCFPIQKQDSLPPNPQIAFKETKPIKALKTVFNGNYRVSDNAWYYLLDEAERKNLEIAPLPIEIYLNDPHEGGNSLEWVSHILLPLRQKGHGSK